MKSFLRRPRWFVSLAMTMLAAIVISGIPSATTAQDAGGLSRLSAATAAEFNALPLTAGTGAAPVVMLAMSVDEQLYRVAYNDYTDINGDGRIDPTYSDLIDYRGYFDPQLCYEYDDGRFRADATVRTGTHKCNRDWSGNFLNWVSMSRLDVIRAGLYGGLRVAGGDRGTILERAYLPPESAAWVKVYRGPDPISDYTPFNDIGSTVSFCNVSLASNSQTVADSRNDTASRPLLRVARGNFPLWSSTELLQCLWDEGAGDRPALSSDGSREFIVRVEACSADRSNLREMFCRGYPAENPTVWRPAGALQEFGESGRVRFGMMTGSYARPRSGGQLRRNPGRLAGNGNNPSSCTRGDEIQLSNGAFCNRGPGDEGIINTLDRLRPSRYRFSTGNPPDSFHVDCEGVNRDVSNRAGDGVIQNSNLCNGTGNPIAEMMAETLRYLSGAATPMPLFDARSADASFINGIPTPAWTDPFSGEDLCAECSILVISSGSNSFDADELPSITQLNLDAPSIAGETNRIGTNEGIDGSMVLTGRTAAATTLPDTINDSCQVRGLAHLADARGICPVQPGQEGGFHVAGLSLAAWTRDLRADTGRQRAQTFAMSFGDELGSIRIPTNSGTVTVTPACEVANFPPRSCALVSMQPGPVRSNRSRNSLAPYEYGRTISADGRSGSVMVSWHSAIYGFQRDDEVTQVLSWCVGNSCATNLNQYAANSSATDICWRADNSSPSPCRANGSLDAIGENDVLIRTEIITGRPSLTDATGFIIEGASANNGRMLLVNRPTDSPAGSGNFVAADNLINSANAAGAEPNASNGNLTGPAATWGRPQVRRFTAGSAVRHLENPLFYAAKYGSFDSSATPLPTASVAGPCVATSWDQINNRTGGTGADCVPDNYHDLANPGDFVDRLTRVLQTVARRTATGELTQSGAAVASVGQGAGAVYQALYESSRRVGNESVSWMGTVQALFVDRNGNLREAATGEEDGSRRLVEDDYVRNPVVRLLFDEVNNETRFTRITVNPADGANTTGVTLATSELRTIWNASDRLSALPSGSSLATQRAYDVSAANGRHIFTFVDRNLDGRAEASETVDLTAEAFTSNLYGLLDVSSPTEATRLIRFARGINEPGLRSRTLGSQVLRLGDIVNSAPLAVGAPAEAYDLLYADQSYAAFFAKYRSRRNMVYVGANDGMLHAFNGGFFDAGAGSFSVASTDAPSAVRHPLGSEIWAYVPFNLLPHLSWMADRNYGHVWTMDGSPRAFDVRVFAPDDVHLNGWGTLLVVPMRLGGRSITIPFASQPAGFNGLTPPANVDALTTRPAYVILDITDPEQPPRLIAEFSHPMLGFTTSNPAIAAFSTPGAAPGPAVGDNRWYLMFGNGPDNLQTAESAATQQAKLFRLDLNELVAGTGPAINSLLGGNPINLPNGPANGFAGDPVAVDWNLNFRADALYMGTSGGTAAAPTGKLFKLDFRTTDSAVQESSDASGWRQPVVLLEAGSPILAAPSVTQDRNGNRWVLGGTGRYLADADRTSSTAQVLFGVMDRGDLPLALGTLVDTSNATVDINGNVAGVSGNLGDGAQATTEPRLLELVSGARGWRFGLNRLSPTVPSERSINRTAVLDSLLFATSFTPADSLCSGAGNSRLFGFDFRTGAPRSNRPAFGFDLATNADDDLRGVINLGKGLSTAPTLHLNSTGPNGRGTLTINVQSSTGAIFQQEVEVSGAIRSNEIDWRENHPDGGP